MIVAIVGNAQAMGVCARTSKVHLGGNIREAPRIIQNKYGFYLFDVKIIKRHF